MWDFFTALLQQSGILGIVCAVEAIALFTLVKLYVRKDERVEGIQQQLVDLSEKRLNDVVEDRDKYEDLSQDLNKSINLLVQVFKRKHDLNGDMEE
jgi:hypothetical protein